MKKFRYEVVGGKKYCREYRWIFSDDDEAMTFAQKLLSNHKQEEHIENEDDNYMVLIEIHEEAIQ